MIKTFLIAVLLSVRCFASLTPTTLFTQLGEFIVKPRLVDNGVGDAAIFWVLNPGGDDTVYLSLKPSGLSWTSLFTYVPTQVSPFQFLQAHLNSSKRFSIGWETGGYPNYGFQLVTKAMGGDWSAQTEQISFGENYYIFHLGLNPTGGYSVIGVGSEVTERFWLDWDAIRIANISDVGVLSPLETISSGPSLVRRLPKIFFNGSGDGVSSWVERDYGGNLQSVMANWLISGEWGTPQELNSFSNEYFAENHKAFVDESGNAALCWTLKQSEDGTAKLQAATYFSSTWSAVTDLSLLSSDARKQEVVINGNGDVFIVYETDLDGQIEAAFKPSGSSWQLNSRATLPSGSNISPHVKVTSSGDFIVVWENVSSGSSKVYESIFASGDSTWSAPVLLSPSDVSCTNPDIALTTSGNAVVLWLAVQGLDTAVQVADLTY